MCSHLIMFTVALANIPRGCVAPLVDALYQGYNGTVLAYGQVLVFIANGSEEMETISIIDVLRRAKAEVIDASVEDAKETIGSRKVKIVADMLLNEASKLSYDLIALPGGIPGAKKFTSSETLVEMLKKQKFSKKSCGAICASPALVLEPHGLLEWWLVWLV
ncbi:protein DJ-1 homolog B-like isoform X1 [Apium graveolens]|uniref:protein DJ-1 homolog B-like isoform X1 n=1 Tax=Apium graveolens TaxID=4045 RepID=UPI003D7C090F